MSNSGNTDDLPLINFRNNVVEAYSEANSLLELLKLIRERVPKFVVYLSTFYQ